MKALLILDMPGNCNDCDFQEWRKDVGWGDGYYCMVNGGQCLNCKRPGWCPLQKIPERKEHLYVTSTAEACLQERQAGINEGWNACLNTILDLQN